MKNYLLFLRIFAIYAAIGYVSEWYSINIIELENKEPLVDTGFEIIPHLNPKICDVTLSLMCLYFGIKWFIVDVTKLTTYLNIMTWIFLIRLLCFTITTVPHPIGNECTGRKPNDPIIWNVLPYLWNHYKHSCYDLMFSGHAAHATLIMMFTLVYSKNNYERYIITAMNMICNLLIIASRFHYSHDVIIGTAISILSFGAYHSIILCPTFNKSIDKVSNKQKN